MARRASAWYTPGINLVGGQVSIRERAGLSEGSRGPRGRKALCGFLKGGCNDH